MEEIFRKACKNEDIKYVKLMLKEYIRSIYGTETTKFIKNDITLQKLILYTNKIDSNNINLQIHKFNALSYAHHIGDIDVFMCLVENKEKYNCDITNNICDFLYDSCINQHIEIVKYILNYSIRTNNIININILIKYHKLCFTALTYIYASINILKCLIEYCEKINDKYDIFYIDTQYYRELKFNHITIYNYKNKLNKYYSILQYCIYLKKHNYNKKNDYVSAINFMIVSKYINNNKNISTYLNSDDIGIYKCNYIRVLNMYISNNILRVDTNLIYYRYIEYSFCIKRIY